MRDVMLVVAVALAFAWVTTAHLAIVAGLLRRASYGRAAAALLIPPLAPYWAWSEHMRIRLIAWIAGAIAYGVAFAIAWSSG